MSSKQVAQAKTHLRATIRQQRSTTTGQARQVSAVKLAHHAWKHPLVRSASTVAAYLAQPGEPDLGILIEHLSHHGKRVLLPVVPAEPATPSTLASGTLASGTLGWAYDHGAQTRSTGRYGLSIPSGPPLPPRHLATAQVIFIPALAVDHTGVRLGQGAGWYDLSLAVLRQHLTPNDHPLLVAVVHQQEFVAHLPSDSHDQPVHAVLTEEQWMSVKATTRRWRSQDSFSKSPASTQCVARW